MIEREALLGRRLGRRAWRFAEGFPAPLPRADQIERARSTIGRRLNMKTWLMASLTALALALPLAPVLAAEQSPDTQKQMAQMQERMKKMQEEMNRIHQTQDPQERKKLMQDHMQTMQEQMKDMHGMGGGMMMGMMGQSGGAMHQKGKMDPEKRQQMMQDRMDMMQMMMEQMMDQIQMQAPAK
jgi:hypothetical protein